MSSLLSSPAGRSLLLRPIVFSRPLRLVEPTSWVPHLPFAFWVVDAHRPRTLVELGTMSGNSFAAFAQAVQALGLDAACYAVDTWQGDLHSGLYGDQVFEEWSAFHEQQFGAFSRLVRTTFDEASAMFPDASIDLLHIDGFHSYEAVRHDFETWLPKLSARAVVLLHDTNVREREFGVWKFWQEISSRYPSFSFLHGHGLGVLGVGQDLSPDLQALLSEIAKSNEDSAFVRQLFGTLGEALLRQPREAALARREAALHEQLSARTAEAEQIRAAVIEGEQALLEARAALVARDNDLGTALETAARLEAENGRLRVERERLAAAELAICSRVDDINERARESVSRLDSIEVRVRDHERQQADVAASLRQLETAADTDRGRHELAFTQAERDAAGAFAFVQAAHLRRARGPLVPFRQTVALARALVRRARVRRQVSGQPVTLRTFLQPSLPAQARLVRSSGVFDATHYLRQLAGRTSEADLAAALADPLWHYLAVGALRGVHPHPLFDSGFYARQNPDVVRTGTDPLSHYLRFGGFEGRDPHPLFDSAFYLETYPDVAGDRTNPLVHYLRYGAREGRNPSRWFDTSYYLDANPEVRESGENPLVHYLRVGGAEGRAAGPAFDSARYLQTNPDVARVGMNPLLHFLIAGRTEGRVLAGDVAAAGSSLLAAPGNLEASAEAYASVAARAAQIEAQRIAGLRVRRPNLIELTEKDDLGARARVIRLRPESDPLVSVVIPVLNGLRFTIECLLALERAIDDVSFEVIVVDNGSTDASPDVLPHVPQLRYVRHDRNIGFGPGCNSGADAASGRYIVFLNNDAQVQPGWLTSLVSAFSSSEGVGAVGPKVLFPDGRLQDAGSAINPDCTSTMIGVFDDPALPRFNYRRDVQYLSAVCVMLDRERFTAGGGFDPLFAPAYCEDVDLCLRLREQGLRLIYEPTAVVVHRLSATSNEQGGSFKMAAVTRHQQKLSVRHQEAIDSLNDARVIAFYLPQFHPIPENDVWWGKGFTEWRNVTRSRPNFTGHYQPRLPGDLGFYDLSLRETYSHQVELARRYGVDGFCLYYYWFAGKRLLERPLDRMLEDPAFEFPFCICWANENWTRRWDGKDHEVLMAQAHTTADDISVISDLMRYIQHPAYIRVGGKPLLLIYSASRFPDIRSTLRTWRTECRERGVGEIYLAMVESFDLTDQKVTPAELGFDAGVEFPPHNGGVHPVQVRDAVPQFRGQVFSYEQTAVHYMTRPAPGYPCFRTAMPGWDNTPRRLHDGVVFAGSTPGAYQAWLESALRRTREQLTGDEQLVFINAWNEWAEGAYLEPDLGWGHGYLEATRNSRQNVRLGLNG